MSDDVKAAVEWLRDVVRLAKRDNASGFRLDYGNEAALLDWFDGEPARIKAAKQAAVLEWRAGAADRDALRADCERRIAEATAAQSRAEEGVRYWTDLAQAEARDAAAARAQVEAAREACRALQSDRYGADSVRWSSAADVLRAMDGVTTRHD